MEVTPNQALRMIGISPFKIEMEPNKALKSGLRVKLNLRGTTNMKVQRPQIKPD